jgi:hypothetical protein
MMPNYTGILWKDLALEILAWALLIGAISLTIIAGVN